MNRMSVVLGLVVWVAVGARADFTRGSQTVAIMGGLSASGQTYDLNGPEEKAITGPGGAWGAQYLYYVSDTPSIAFGIDANVSPNGPLRTRELLTNFETTARMKSTSVLALARLSWPKGIWRPYIFAGLGGHRSSIYLSAKPSSLGTWADTGTRESRILTEDSTTSVAIGYGIGMDLFAGEHFFMGFELRGTALPGLDDDPTPEAQSAGILIDREPASQGNILARIGVKF